MLIPAGHMKILKITLPSPRTPASVSWTGKNTQKQEPPSMWGGMFGATSDMLHCRANVKYDAMSQVLGPAWSHEQAKYSHNRKVYWTPAPSSKKQDQIAKHSTVNHIHSSCLAQTERILFQLVACQHYIVDKVTQMVNGLFRLI